MKLIQIIHRATGHSAKVSINEAERFYIVEYCYRGLECNNCYIANTLQDAIETAQLELMILQDQD